MLATSSDLCTVGARDAANQGSDIPIWALVRAVRTPANETAQAPVRPPGPGPDAHRMTAYEDTIESVRALAARAGAADDVLFCEQRPLTSLEARFAGVVGLAERLRSIEDDGLRALRGLVDREEGYETALQAIEAAGGDATNWLRAVLLAKSLETLPVNPTRDDGTG